MTVVDDAIQVFLKSEYVDYPQSVLVVEVPKKRQSEVDNPDGWVYDGSTEIGDTIPFAWVDSDEIKPRLVTHNELIAMVNKRLSYITRQCDEKYQREKENHRDRMRQLSENLRVEFEELHNKRRDVQKQLDSIIQEQELDERKTRSE